MPGPVPPVAAEDDNVKLMTCTARKLVRYCSVACQRDHRQQHKRACKKRMAELREDLLFVRLKAVTSKTAQSACCRCLDQTRQLDLWCCGKIVCQGCFIADGVRQQRHLRHSSGSFTQTCAFCHHPIPETVAEIEAHVIRREFRRMIDLQSVRWVECIPLERTMPRWFSIGPRQLKWETWTRIII